MIYKLCENSEKDKNETKFGPWQTNDSDKLQDKIIGNKKWKKNQRQKSQIIESTPISTQRNLLKFKFHKNWIRQKSYQLKTQQSQTINYQQQNRMIERIKMLTTQPNIIEENSEIISKNRINESLKNALRCYKEILSQNKKQKICSQKNIVKTYRTYQNSKLSSRKLIQTKEYETLKNKKFSKFDSHFLQFIKTKNKHKNIKLLLPNLI